MRPWQEAWVGWGKNGPELYIMIACQMSELFTHEKGESQKENKMLACEKKKSVEIKPCLMLYL